MKDCILNNILKPTQGICRFYYKDYEINVTTLMLNFTKVVIYESKDCNEGRIFDSVEDAINYINEKIKEPSK